MDDDDWASDGGEEGGLGDISAIPAVPVADIPPAATAKPNTSLNQVGKGDSSTGRSASKTFQRANPVPPPNAWNNTSQSGDFRSPLARLRSHPPQRRDITSSPQSIHSAPPGIQNTLHDRNQSLRQNNVFHSNNVNNNATRQATAQMKDLHLNQQQYAPQSSSPSQTSAGPHGNEASITGGSIFVSNLPIDSTQADIADFFMSKGAPTSEIRVIRSQETGRVRAAVIRLMPDTSFQKALSLNGAILNGRTLNVRRDNQEHQRRRNNNNNTHHHGGNQFQDRSDRLSGFNSGHPPRSPRVHSNRAPPQPQRHSFGRGTGGQHMLSQAALSDSALPILSDTSDQAAGATNSISSSSLDGGRILERTDRRGGPDQRQRDLGSNNSDRNGRPQSWKGGIVNGNDPTIPTGPIPSGRKRLELKPRTKPLPVLEIDKRLIDGPSKTPSAPPGIPKPINPPTTTTATAQYSTDSLNSATDPSKGSISNQQHANSKSAERPLVNSTNNQSPNSSKGKVTSSISSTAPPGKTKPVEGVNVESPQRSEEATNGISEHRGDAPSVVERKGNNNGGKNDNHKNVSSNVGTATQGDKRGRTDIGANGSLPGRQIRGDSRPRSERFSSRRPASERFSSSDGISGGGGGRGRSGQERTPSTRGTGKDGRQHISQNMNTEDHIKDRVNSRAERNNRPSRFSMAEKKEDDTRKSFKSANPFDALMNDVDDSD